MLSRCRAVSSACTPGASPTRRTGRRACRTGSTWTARSSSWCAPSCAPMRARRAMRWSISTARSARSATRARRRRTTAWRAPCCGRAARAKRALGEPAAAAALLAGARARFPYSNPVLYAYAAALQDTGRNAEALALLAEPLRLHPRDYRLYALQSKTYAALGKRLLQHHAQAEFYVLQGSLPAAIEQLQLARSAGDGDFYQLSVVDARLKDLRAQYSLEMRDAKR